MFKHLSHTIAAAGCALALCLGTTACASSAAPATAEHSITVSATSHVSVVPDLCNFSISVYERADNASSAQRAAAKPVKAIIKMLKDRGIDEKDIQTTYADVSPYWDEDGMTDEYEARSELLVSNVPVDQVGELMQAASEAGASSVNMLEYRSSSYQQSYEEALAQAISDTKPKAEAIAAASGVKLGKVISVSEGYQDMGLYAEEVAMASADAMDADAGKGMDIAPGEVNIEAQVTVTYAIN